MSFTHRASQYRASTGVKTDRLDTDLLKRSFLGWLRGERDHSRFSTLIASTSFGSTTTK
jgi:hypothetical protein